MALNVVELAKDLIRCPSVTPVDAGVFDVLQKALEGMGFTVIRKTSTAEGYEPVDNLYARLGTQAPNICFAGHTDVVPVGDESQWDHPPFEPTVDGGKLYGRGAEDMKGAIASFVAAVSRMKEQGAIGGSISLLITGDEEGIAVNGTRKALIWMKEMGETIDACIVGEPTNPTYIGEMVKIGRRGSLLCNLQIDGKQGHVAYPDLADNPNTRLINMLHALKAEPIDEGNKAFPPSNLEITSMDVGNNVDNMIPSTARAKFNIRFNNQFTGETMEKWVRDKLDSVGGSYQLDARISGESFLTNNEQLIRSMIEAIKQVTGHTPKLSTTGGTSDARFIKDYAPVIEFGTTGFTPHMVNECVEVEALEQLSQVYEQFLKLMLPAQDSTDATKEAVAPAAQETSSTADESQQASSQAKTAEPSVTSEAAEATSSQQEATSAEPAQPVSQETQLGEKSAENLQATEIGGKKDDTMQGTTLGGKAEETNQDTQLGAKSAENLQATELGGKGDADMQATELGGKGSKDNLQDTELGGKGAQALNDTELSGKKNEENLQATELGGKGSAENLQDTELAGKEGANNLQDTELAGKQEAENQTSAKTIDHESDKADMQDTELAGKSEQAAEATSQEAYKGKTKEYESTELKMEEKKKELHIDESNEETFRAMIKGAYPSLSLLFLRKCLFERIVEMHGRTMRDDKTIKEIDVMIGNTRQKMLSKIAFVGANEAATFVKKEMDGLYDEQQKKALAMKGDPSVIRDKLEVLPPEWKG